MLRQRGKVDAVKVEEEVESVDAKEPGMILPISENVRQCPSGTPRQPRVSFSPQSSIT